MSNVIGHNVFNLNHKTRVSWVRIAAIPYDLHQSYPVFRIFSSETMVQPRSHSKMYLKCYSDWIGRPTNPAPRIGSCANPEKN